MITRRSAIVSGLAALAEYKALGQYVPAGSMFPAPLPPPVIRGSNSMNAVSNSFTVSFSSGWVGSPPQAGDFALLFFGGAFTPTTPSGWTVVWVAANASISLTTVGIYSKVLNSTDISTGSVTLNLSGSFNGVLSIAALVGATSGIREIETQNDESVPSHTLTTSSSVLTSDIGFYFATGRVATTGGSVAISRGTLLQANNSGSVTVAANLNDESMPGGATSVTFTNSDPAQGFATAIVIVEH